MSELSEFEVKFYTNFADKFVDKYIEQGRRVAGTYAVEHIKKEMHKCVKPFVDEAFLRRGYVC